MPDNEDFAAFLSAVGNGKAVPGLAGELRAIARTMEIERGGLARIDAQSDQIVFVSRGATKLVAHASGGREQVVAFHFAGDLVSVPARAAHVYALTALTASALVVFPAKRFLEIVEGQPTIQSDVINRLLTALHRSRDKSVNLGRKTASERIAGFLVTMGERIGRPGDSGLHIDLPMSRRDIGDSLGLTIETVSRQFTELRTEGLVTTIGRSGVDLRDPAALAARAGQISALS